MELGKDGLEKIGDHAYMRGILFYQKNGESPQKNLLRQKRRQQEQIEMVLENRKHRGREAAIQRELEKEVGKRLGEAIGKAMKGK